MSKEEHILRHLYTSDILLADQEFEMMYNVDDRVFDLLEEFHSREEDGHITIEENEFSELENSFYNFYFEYAYIQFKRGLEIGLAMKNMY